MNILYTVFSYFLLPPTFSPHPFSKTLTHTLKANLRLGLSSLIRREMFSKMLKALLVVGALFFPTTIEAAPWSFFKQPENEEPYSLMVEQIEASGIVPDMTLGDFIGLLEYVKTTEFCPLTGEQLHDTSPIPDMTLNDFIDLGLLCEFHPSPFGTEEPLTDTAENRCLQAYFSKRGGHPAFASVPA